MSAEIKFWIRHEERVYPSDVSWGIAFANIIEGIRKAGFPCRVSRVAVDEFDESGEWIEIQHSEPWNICFRSQPQKRLWYGVWSCECFPEDRILEWRERISKVDGILAPSSEALRIFKLHVERPMGILPHGFDPDVWKPAERDWSAKPFTFLVLGIPQFKKGSWLIYEAFQRAFAGETHVRLITKANGWLGDFQMFRSQYSTDPRMVWDQSPGREAAYSAAANSHVLVSASLFEIYNMPVVECMASGMPCIIPRNGGPLDYFSDEFGWWIELSTAFAAVEKTYPNTSGFWRLPKTESLAELMRYAFDHRDECAEKGARAAIHAFRHMRTDVIVTRDLVPFARSLGRRLVDIGCGRTKPFGWIGIDVQAFPQVDIVRDVSKAGLPFCDSSVDEIRADNSLEHMSDLMFVMAEVHRVLKSGGLFHVWVPFVNVNPDGAFCDPKHVRFFTTHTFRYFTDDGSTYSKVYPTASRFRIVKQESDQGYVLLQKP